MYHCIRNYRSHHVGSHQVQAYLSKSCVPKRAKEQIDGRILAIAAEPELPLMPPPSPENEKEEMMDLGLEAAEE